MATINAIVRGAYATIIRLQNGTVTTIADYRRSNSTEPITGVMQGAYTELIQNSDGQFIPLVDHLRSTGGQLISKVASGSYPALVKAGTTAMTLIEYQAAEEVAQAAQ